MEQIKDTAIIMGVFVIGCFLASVVWYLYIGGSNGVSDPEPRDDQQAGKVENRS